MAELYENLAVIISPARARSGSGLLIIIVSFVLYHIGTSKIINRIEDRHGYGSENYKIAGVIYLSFFCSTLGLVIGYGVSKQALSIIIYALGFCAVISFFISTLFLGFRLPHNLIIGSVAPAILALAVFLSTSTVTAVIRFIVDTIY